jgi:hypothetical protein
MLMTFAPAAHATRSVLLDYARRLREWSCVALLFEAAGLFCAADRRVTFFGGENWWRRRESKRRRLDARNSLRDANFPCIRLQPLMYFDPAASSLVPPHTTGIRGFMTTVWQTGPCRL